MILSALGAGIYWAFMTALQLAAKI